MANNLPSTQSNTRYDLKKFTVPIIIILVLLFLREFLGFIISKILADTISPNNDPKFELLLNLVLNIVITILMLIIVWILIKLSILKLNPQTPNKNFGVKETSFTYLSAFSLVFIFGIIMTTLGTIMNNVPESSYESITLVPGNLTIFNVLLLFILLTILAPIFEELVFRRLFIPMLEGGFGTYGALIISSICFGLIHTDNDLINGNFIFALTHLGNTIILGLGLGFVYILTRNIIYPILFHGFNNFFPPFISQLFLAFLDIDINAEIDPNRLNDYTILSVLSILLIAQTIIGLIIIGKVFLNRERKRKIKIFVQQNPPLINYSLREKIIIGSTILSFFTFFTVIWNVYIRIFIYKDILFLNTNEVLIFIILSDLFLILIFSIVLYKKRSTIVHLASITNPKIDLAKINEQIYQDETKLVYNITEFQKFCLHCGSKLQEHAQFCIDCGRKLEGA